MPEMTLEKVGFGQGSKDIGYANSLNDVNNIVSYYHDIVSSSNELTQTEKICILMCIEITKYSYSFWQDYGLQ